MNGTPNEGIIYNLYQMGTKKLPASRYYLHFFFWILVLSWFALNNRAILSEGVFVYLSTVVSRTILLAAVVYIHMLWLYPAFYKKKKSQDLKYR